MNKNLVSILALTAILVGCGGGGSTNVRPDEPLPTEPPPFDTVHLEIINADDAHAVNAKGADILVAVLDSGIRATHDEFSDTTIHTGTNVVPDEDPADVTDTVGHGTRVASLIAGKNVGVAPEAAILPVRVFPENSGAGNSDYLLDAANYARAQGANVQNLSLSLVSHPDNLSVLEDNAAANVLTVVAAGNDGDTNPDPWVLLDNADSGISDDALSKVLVVGAVNSDNVIASFSDRAGVTKDRFLVAPGVGVSGADHYGDDSYSDATGTSFATPLVSGAAAVVWSADPSLTADQVADILLLTATDLGDPGVDEIYGHGLLNLEAALLPVGALGIPMLNHASDGTFLAIHTNVRLSGAFGDALSGSQALRQVVTLDDFNRPYTLDLSGAVHGAASADLLTARMSTIGTRSESVEQEIVGVRVAATFSGLPSGLRLHHDEWAMESTTSPAPGHLSTLSVSGQQGGVGYQMVDGGQPSSLFGVGQMVGGNWLGSAAVDTAHLNLMVRDNQSALLSTGGDGWSMRAGFAQGRAPTLSDVPVTSGVVAWEKAAVGAAWSLTLSHTTEHGAFLGSEASGALGAGTAAATSAVGLGVVVPLHEGVRAFAGASLGLTTVDGQTGSMLQNWRDLRTSSYGMGVVAANEGRELGFRVVRPLRVDSGLVDLDVPVERLLDHSVVRERGTANLSPSGQEVAIESYYRFAQANGNTLGLSAMYRIEPNHIRSAEPEFVTMMEGRLQW